MISDLPEDMTKEIFSRVPLTSLSAVRSTSKKWNSISKSQVLCESATKRKQFLGFMVKDLRVCSMKFDLRGIRSQENFVHPSIKQVSILDQVEISHIYQCEGLLLCVTRDKSRLLVWNPYLGQTKWIQPRNSFHMLDNYAIGYDKNRNYKILRIFGEFMVFGYDIYDLSSNSWKVSNFNPDWYIYHYQRGVSLKGHVYFLAEEKTRIGGNDIEYILSFDFTTERFGKRLPLPFKSHGLHKNMSISCVREKQLAVLHQRRVFPDNALEIWITNKIDPCEVSWRKFLRITFGCLDGNLAGSFFVDEEKKIVVVVDLECYKGGIVCNQTTNMIGQDGYFKSVNMGKAHECLENFGFMTRHFCRPLVCSSYVPSSVQLQTNQPGKFVAFVTVFDQLVSSLLFWFQTLLQHLASLTS